MGTHDLTEFQKYYNLESYLFDVVGPNFHKRRPKYLTLEEIILIVTWKTPRSVHWFIDGFKENYSHIEKLSEIFALYNFNSNSDDAMIVLNRLCENKEIKGLGGIPMTSAFLTVLYPEDFTLIDWRAKETFEKHPDLKIFYKEGCACFVPDPTKNVESYLKYVAVCKEASKKLHFKNLRSFDKALWGHSFYLGLERSLQNIPEAKCV